MRRRICILKGCDIVLDFPTDFLFGRAGEALSLAFALPMFLAFLRIVDRSAVLDVSVLVYDVCEISDRMTERSNIVRRNQKIYTDNFLRLNPFLYQ